MVLDKKKNSSKFSLREVFSPGSKQSLPPATDASPTSHRLLLKKKDSKGSMISPQTSSSSLGSLLRGKQHHSKSAEALNVHSSALINRPSPESVPALLDVTPYTLNERVSGKLDDHHSEATNKEQEKSQQQHQTAKPLNKHNKLNSSSTDSHHSHSHLSLKRFLKKFKHSPTSDHHHSSHPHHNNSSSTSLASSLHATHFFHSTSAPNSSDMFKKYGNLGKLLGSGATGSVSILTSESNPNKVYAVKKFRAKLQNETELDYKLKVKNEFKIGEVLTHQNLIHTYELIKDSGSKFLSDTEFYIVMEYCPYDFFNLVMSGLMDKKEIACYFKQIINGVAYLHENGLAHRDLKLDNCVVNANGILKLIDFGLAVHFRRDKTTANTASSEDDLDENYRLIRARGIVGSDPYLAPEVFEPSNFGYDPRLVDIWSIAIIYCCMILKRFPWKLPRESDQSYKAFAGITDEPKEKAKSNDEVKIEKEVIAKSVNDSETSSIHVSANLAPQKNNAAPGEVTDPEIGPLKEATPDITTAQQQQISSLSPESAGGAQVQVPELSLPSTAHALPAHPSPAPSSSSQKKLPPRGPERLLRILPPDLRPLIKGMLTIKTSERFLIADILKDDFYNSIELCTQDPSTDIYVPAGNHKHHLVTEEELQKLNEEKEKLKHLKQEGMA